MQSNSLARTKTDYFGPARSISSSYPGAGILRTSETALWLDCNVY
ncbi:hypothetical protein EDB94_0364 [Marinobacter sp. 3-2]|nr:hypothetical protein EDB94_0364 [Marinobacter sp. 3-2]